MTAFEVNYTPIGNLTVEVRARDHDGDLVIATALTLWSAEGVLRAGSRSGRVAVMGES